MRLAIMQPYILPYIGYFQLINAVDEFVVYDKIQYSKKGWINRNRILVNNSDAYFTIPLKKDSDFLNIKERSLSNDWGFEKKKILNKIKESYKKAPFFSENFPIIEDIFLFDNSNLFEFIYNSINKLVFFFELKTKLVISSTCDFDNSLKSEEKVLAICKSRDASIYINPIGGIELYNVESFRKNGIELKFLKTNPFRYNQFSNEFIPFLSVIDVMMFNSKKDIISYIQFEFTLK